MAIQTRNKRSVSFSMVSMSDIVFLLLIFFMLTSTLIAPNAIKLLLPTSNSRTIAKQTVTVYINDKLQYYVNETPVSVNTLENRIKENLKEQKEGSVVLKSDYTVAIQYVVNVINAVNNINEKNKTKHKVILATRPKP